MKSLEIRKKFFDFFIKHNHEKIESSSLIPAQDPTLLFTNAGMNQFKDLFLGNEKRNYKRATTVQKCVRAGGKHNDLDNVGFTKRHLTFFEMMGNFSFGDYFKKEAISYAWEFLTKDMHLDPKNMFVSVYQEDDESFKIWEDMGVPTERIYRFGKKDNFWQMGDTGPCGPCTEIFLDLRPEDKRHTLPTQEDFDSGIILEIWNNVFMQFDRQQDGTLVPLKQTGVDTGMGLERLTCVMQNVDSVYQTDIFIPLIHETEKLTGVDYSKSSSSIKAAFHVLADHIRSSSLIIADGGSPSNEGRGYVLRKIIRRAALFTQKLTAKNIFPDLAKKFISQMSPIYPELAINQTMIVNLLTSEIDQFANNLIRGQQILETYFKEADAKKIITGQQAFKLYDTYGFPLEVTILASEERGYTVDAQGFETFMEEQRLLSGKKMKSAQQELILPETIKTDFVGYTTTHISSEVIFILVDNQPVQTVKSGQDCWVITKVCPFFVATGGQVDDTGTVTIKGHSAPVDALQKLSNKTTIAFCITAPIDFSLGETIDQKVQTNLRTMTMNNHTATHMLQAALIELFGKQIKQSGSVVNPDYLRFDFTYHQNLTTAEIKQVEDRVNEKIRENIEVQVFETTYKKALEHGAIAIFGEKYNPENVRVVDIPHYSTELCGGTHVAATGAIGLFKITEMGALSAGNRRITAVTGIRALELMQENFNALKTLSQKFAVKPEEVLTALEKQDELLKITQLTVKSLKKQALQAELVLWAKNIKSINGVPFLFVKTADYNLDELRDAATQLQSKNPGFYIFIAEESEHKSSFYAALSADYSSKIDLKSFGLWLNETSGLKGGGKPGTLQGGGQAVAKDLETNIKDWISGN